MTITVTCAWTQRGWSQDDHLIDDSRMAEVVGREFASVEHARRAVEARGDRRGYQSFRYLLGGREWEWDGSAGLGIPGRYVPAVRLIED